MIWSEYTTWIGDLYPTPLSATGAASATPFTTDRLNTALSESISFAELRLLRDPDLNFLAAYTTATSTCAAGTRTVAKPASMIVAESLAVISPAGSAPNASNSTRTPLLPASRDFINFAWGSMTVASRGLPTYVAPQDDSTFVLGPVPDAAYQIEFYGTVRPTPLSSTNTSNFLTLNLPDLYVVAAMIYWNAIKQNWSALAEDAPGATTWVTQYNDLKKGAAVEEARKKSQSAGWQTMAPAPVAALPRA